MSICMKEFRVETLRQLNNLIPIDDLFCLFADQKPRKTKFRIADSAVASRKRKLMFRDEISRSLAYQLKRCCEIVARFTVALIMRATNFMRNFHDAFWRPMRRLRCRPPRPFHLQRKKIIHYRSGKITKVKQQLITCCSRRLLTHFFAQFLLFP